MSGWAVELPYAVGEPSIVAFAVVSKVGHWVPLARLEVLEEVRGSANASLARASVHDPTFERKSRLAENSQELEQRENSIGISPDSERPSVAVSLRLS